MNSVLWRTCFLLIVIAMPGCQGNDSAAVSRFQNAIKSLEAFQNFSAQNEFDGRSYFKENAAIYLNSVRSASVDALWARADIHVEWTDNSNQVQSERGEGHLILRMPHKIALSYEKLGEVYGWIGANEELFWYYGKEESQAWVARRSNANDPRLSSAIFGILPDRFIDMLGLLIVDFPPRVHLSNGNNAEVNKFPEVDRTIIPPDYFDDETLAIIDALNTGRQSIQMFTVARGDMSRPFLMNVVFIRGSYSAVVVDLIDPLSNKPIVRSVLNNYVPIKGPSLATDIGTQVPSKITIKLFKGKIFPNNVKITIETKHIGSIPLYANEINDAVFDFYSLRRGWQLKTIDILDANCPNPALIPESELGLSLDN